ncbi:protein kinase domain-containing protein [Planctomyces sp. SH-PL62]|uniref:protein kinase domain-containing protein n=1 Tax=Planctomyces sp. SH-PL62 TaxID=1636152 RepID=UPI00078C7CAF|nr:protein kinase [Planctomyces sp. SH-PL62]AMV36278.1 Serine/threonine-protein kinase pkn5 [Planctomyces sp. SH-PL62]
MSTACGSDSGQGQGHHPPTEAGGLDEPLHSPTEAGGPDEPPHPATPPSRIFGDYQILREVGRGGMGIVYEAWQISLRRTVALKVLSVGLSDEKRRGRFEREARAAGRLHHTNIVPVFGSGEHEGTPFYVMQFIRGVGLDAVLDESRRPPSRLDATEESTDPSADGAAAREAVGSATAPATAAPRPVETQADSARERSFLAVARSLLGRGAPPPGDASGAKEPGAEASEPTGPRSSPQAERGDDRPPWKWVAGLGVQAAEGLDYAHSQGIFHRDVKPSNLLLDERGTVWVTDFGLAKWGEHQDATQSGDVVGTLRYLPPEAFDGQSGATTDVYGLGLTLYELLARRPAFDERDRARLIRQVSEASPPPLRKLDPGIPIDLATVVHKAVEKLPQDRYPTAAAFGADLRRFLEDRPVEARRASLAESYWRWARRNPTIAILGGVLTGVLLLATAGSLMAARWFRDQAEIQRSLASGRREAQVAREAAVVARNEEQQTLYDTRANLAASAWEGNDYGQFRSLLDLMRPRADEVDHRGWEWRYLRGLDGQDRATARTPWERLVSVSVAPDGSSFATASLSGAIRIWDLRDAKLKKVIQNPPPGGAAADLRLGVHALAYSPDGKRLAGPGPDMGAGEIGIFRVETGELERTLQVDQDAILSFAWSPDGSRLAASSSRHVVHFWDVETGARLPLLTGSHLGPIATVALSPDGRLAATAGLDGAVKLWRLGDPPLLTHDLVGHEGEVRAAAFSPDGARLVTAGLDGTVRIWEVATGVSRMVIQAHKGGVLCLTYAPSGDWIATGGNDDAIRIWEPGSSRLLRKFLGHTQGVRALAPSRDGQSLVSVSTEGIAKVWDPLSPARPRTLRDASVLRFGGSAGCLALSPDGRLMASGHDDQVVRLWDLPTGRLLRQLGGHDSRVRSLSISPDGRLLVSSAGDPSRPPEDRGVVIVWDLASGRPLREYREHRDVVDDLVFLGDGSWIASAGGDGTVQIWNAETGERRTTLEGHSESVRRLALSRDARWLASGSSDATVKLWDLASGSLQATLKTGGEVLAIAIDDTGRTIATASRNGPIRLWDTAHLANSRPLDGHLGEVFGLVFTPDGRLVSGGADKAIRIWDPTRGRTILSLNEHASAVTALAVSRDGGVLVSASRDLTIKLWDAPPAE